MATPSLNDLWYAWLSSQVPAATQAMFTGGAGTIPVGTGIQNNTQTDSLFASGKVAAPTAFTIICATSAATGLYRVSGMVLYTGAGTPADGTEESNMRVNIGSNAKFPIQIPPVKNVPVIFDFGVFRCNAETVRIGSILAATATVNYSGTIVATRVGD